MVVTGQKYCEGIVLIEKLVLKHPRANRFRNRLGTAVDPQFAVDIGRMPFDRAESDVKTHGYLPVG